MFAASDSGKTCPNVSGHQTADTVAVGYITASKDHPFGHVLTDAFPVGSSGVSYRCVSTGYARSCMQAN